LSYDLFKFSERRICSECENVERNHRKTKQTKNEVPSSVDKFLLNCAGQNNLRLYYDKNRYCLLLSIASHINIYYYYYVHVTRVMYKLVFRLHHLARSHCHHLHHKMCTIYLWILQECCAASVCRCFTLLHTIIVPPHQTTYHYCSLSTLERRLLLLLLL